MKSVSSKSACTTAATNGRSSYTAPCAGCRWAVGVQDLVDDMDNTVACGDVAVTIGSVDHHAVTN